MLIRDTNCCSYQPFCFSSLDRRHNAVPAFLQPNMVLSSRAAIFGDTFDKERASNPSKKPRSNRNSGNDEADSSENDDSDAAAQSILDRLYGQLSGAIEIEGKAVLDVWRLELADQNPGYSCASSHQNRHQHTHLHALTTFAHAFRDFNVKGTAGSLRA